jgi:hypothetical protein
MIKSFKHSGLEEFFHTGSKAGIRLPMPGNSRFNSVFLTQQMLLERWAWTAGTCIRSRASWLVIGQ